MKGRLIFQTWKRCSLCPHNRAHDIEAVIEVADTDEPGLRSDIEDEVQRVLDDAGWFDDGCPGDHADEKRRDGVAWENYKADREVAGAGY